MGQSIRQGRPEANDCTRLDLYNDLERPLWVLTIAGMGIHRKTTTRTVKWQCWYNQDSCDRNGLGERTTTSSMPLVWTVGNMFGPAFGGSLVHPVERFPGLSERSKLLKEYPFALPNIVISVLFILGTSQGTLFLKETLEEKKHRRDYGLIFRSLLTRSWRKPAMKTGHRRGSTVSRWK
jgi:hypothetical protein